MTQLKDHYIKDPARLLIEKGLLFEINRTIMHPLGYALSVEWPETSEETSTAAASTGVVVHVIDAHAYSPGGLVFTDDDCTEKAKALAQFVVASIKRIGSRMRTNGGIVVQESAMSLRQHIDAIKAAIPDRA